MKIRTTFQSSRGSVSCAARDAFSLIEVLVVTGLLSVIIIGLVLMFGQTQRAFKLGTTQVDVLESGRLVSEMMRRELSQMVPANVVNATNFLVEQSPPARYGPPLVPNQYVQDLAGSSFKRANRTQQLLFLTRNNQDWASVGYLVGGTKNGIGSLYRFEYKTRPSFSPLLHTGFFDFDAANLYRFDLPSTNMSRLIEGVVHFRCLVYDTLGRQLTATSIVNNVSLQLDALGTDPKCAFYSNAVPASVELELGILEEKAAERARSIGDATARANFLAQQASKVHIFRWRVPVRNVDPSAYP